jgi:hypothetical protein
MQSVPITIDVVGESDFQQYFSYIMAASFVGGGNRRNPEKTTDLPQVTDKL